MDKILILDFGSQYIQLLARRVRELNVFAEVKPHNMTPKEIKEYNPKGIILSGSPSSVYWEGAPLVDEEIFGLGIPILGICYGMQLINFHCGGTVYKMSEREFGRCEAILDPKCPLFNNMNARQQVWMSHGDNCHREDVAEGFIIVGDSGSNVTAICDYKRKLYGVQFHPEVKHTLNGDKVFDNFLDICGCKRDWKMLDYVDRAKEYIKNIVGDDKVLVLVSGGVDSAVAAVLTAQAVPIENIYCLHVDTGLMRKNESRLVEESLRSIGLKNLFVVNASSEYYEALKGITDPEEKRQIIGDKFIEVQERELTRLGLNSDDVFLCQGTLYTDLIESGRNQAGTAAVIKSHHNVNSPLVIKKRMQGKIVEPNHEIFKDEVREIGRILGLPEEFVGRHPFPGPGLAIRIMGEVDENKVNLLREADEVFIRELKNEEIYDEIWQAFCILLPVKTVGVQGDDRTYGGVVALRAVTSVDGMTADWYQMDPDVLARISNKITNEIRDINRVVYDVTSKPPGTIEWE